MTRHGKRAPSSGLAGTAAPFVGAGTGRPPIRTGKVPHNNRLPGVGRGSIESAGSGGGGRSTAPESRQRWRDVARASQRPFWAPRREIFCLFYQIGRAWCRERVCQDV